MRIRGKIKKQIVLLGLVALLFCTAIVFLVFSVLREKELEEQIVSLQEKDKQNQELVAASAEELNKLKNQDQYLRNEELSHEIKNIRETYDSAVSSYENLLKLKESTKNTQTHDKLFSEAVSYLSKRNYASASATLANLDQQIKQEQEKIAASFKIPANIPSQNSPPRSRLQQTKG